MDIIPGKIAIITNGASGIGTAYVKELFKRGTKACKISNTNRSNEALVKDVRCCYQQDQKLFDLVNVTNKIAFKEALKANMNKIVGLDLTVNGTEEFTDKMYKNVSNLNIPSTNFLNIESCNPETTVYKPSTLELQKLPRCLTYTSNNTFIISSAKSVETPFCYDLPGWRFLKTRSGVNSTSVTPDAELRNKIFPEPEKDFASQLYSLIPQTAEYFFAGVNLLLNEKENGGICKGEVIPIYELAIPDAIENLKNRGIIHTRSINN